MTKMKHTLGPWVALSDGPCDWRVQSIVGNFSVYINSDPGESNQKIAEADANLVAASPMMLGILAELVKHLNDGKSVSPTDEIAHRVRAAVTMATMEKESA
jgi:hypothetical protein